VWVERQIGWPVVKVLNTVIAKALAEGGRPAGSRDRVAFPISGDNPKAKESSLKSSTKSDSIRLTLEQSLNRGGNQPGSPPYCTNPTKEELQSWLKKVDRSSLVTKREKALKAI